MTEHTCVIYILPFSCAFEVAMQPCFESTTIDRRRVFVALWTLQLYEHCALEISGAHHAWPLIHSTCFAFVDLCHKFLECANAFADTILPIFVKERVSELDHMRTLIYPSLFE